MQNPLMYVSQMLDGVLTEVRMNLTSVMRLAGQGVLCYWPTDDEQM